MRQVGVPEAEERGGETERPPSYDVVWELPDGRQESVPVGIDPGWNYNPGKDRMAGLTAALNDTEGE